jgi:hypothetical protein
MPADLPMYKHEASRDDRLPNQDVWLDSSRFQHMRPEKSATASASAHASRCQHMCTSNTLPRGDAPKLSTEASIPVLPIGLLGSCGCDMTVIGRVQLR